MLRLILLSALLYDCLSAGSTHSQEKKLERFLLSNSTLSESRAPLYIAKELGLFEKYGLDAEIVNIRGAAINVASLMAGEIQMAVAAGTVAVTAAARGAPIVIVATMGPTKYNLVARPSIASVQELNGKIIGVGGYGSGDYFVLRRLLPKLGLIPDKNVTILPIGSTSSYDRINVMLAGKVDAVVAIKANIERIKARGAALNVLTGSDEQGLEVSGGEFFTTREFVKSRPGQVKAMLKAFSDAIKMGRENKELFHRVIRKFMKEENPKLLESFYESNYFFGAGPHKPRPLERALDFDIKDLSATVPELKGRKASEFIDTTLLSEVEREGFFSWGKP
jgi:NitT/TauT family transport system substrate-binding protein